MAKLTPKPTNRCVVYTRKSTAKGLDQEYNSIDAQRDACRQYIASQTGEGWTLIDREYDDPAYSGGNLDRPALQRLLADIACGWVDTVVVYKIDRLTRSLADFSKVVEQFDQHNVSFVAVTQHFNTASSMGRLTLNMLLSFAQFEREVGAERVRDKIAASKQKGIWMGGIPPLGYDVKDRKLIINDKEAELVKRIFQHISHNGTLTTLLTQLRAEGVTSKAWTTQKGEHRPGRVVDKGMLYRWLNNRMYLGELSHNGHWYPGQHQAMIDQALWDKAHDVLKKRRQRPERPKAPGAPFLLQGLLKDEDGRALTTYSCGKKKGSSKRYRYYLSTRVIKEGAQKPYWPAGELEIFIVRHVRELLRSEAMIQRIVQHMHQLGDDIDEAQVTVAMANIEAIWHQLFIDEQQRILQCLVDNIVVRTSQIDIEIKASGVGELVGEVAEPNVNEATNDNNGNNQIPTPTNKKTLRTTAPMQMIKISDGRMILSIPISIKRRSGRHRIVLPNGSELGQSSLVAKTESITPLQRALVRGYRWLTRFNQGENITTMAQKEKVDNGYVGRMMRLTTLAPDIVAAILDDNVPSTIKLLELAINPPFLWQEQRKRFGFEKI